MGVSVTRIVKYIRKGEKGDDAVSYIIKATLTQFKTNSARTVTQNCTCTAYKVIGGGVPTPITSSENHTLSVYGYDDNNIVHYNYGSRQSIVFGTNSTSDGTRCTRFEVTLEYNNVVRANMTIPVVMDGAKGDQGPALRGPQAWSDCAVGYKFQAGSSDDEFKDVVLYNGSYYSCIKSHTKTASNYPTSTIDSNNGYWQVSDNVELVATKILLATYALVKNLGVEAIDMKDASGNVLFQAKDGNVICKTGTFENVTISGVLKGVSGSFKNLDCVDSSGNKVGGISFGSDGKMWFEGDLYNQGYDSGKGRGYRFYSSDIWCRGGFGARKRNVLIVNGSYGYYFTKGTSNNGVYVSFDQATSTNNETYYSIRCYGNNGDYSGFPVDTIIFNISGSTTYRFRLILADTQRVMVINGNNSQNNVQIYSHGSKVAWNGGEIAEVVQLPISKINPAPSSSTLGAGLIVGAFRDNNWSA